MIDYIDSMMLELNKVEVVLKLKRAIRSPFFYLNNFLIISMFINLDMPPSDIPNAIGYNI